MINRVSPEDFFDPVDYRIELMFLGLIFLRYEDNREEALDLFECYPKLANYFFFDNLRKYFAELKSAYVYNKKKEDFSEDFKKTIGSLTEREVHDGTEAPKLSEVAKMLVEIREKQRKRVGDFLNHVELTTGIEILEDEELLINLKKRT